MSQLNQKWSWMNEPELMDRLTKAQNHPMNSNQDIMTFVGFMSSHEELLKHVVFYETRIKGK